MSEVFDNERFDTIRFFRFLIKKRRVLFVIGIIGALASAGVTMLISPRYYSVGIIFPTASNSAQRVLENPQFGYDLDADRLMQILESEVVMDSVIKKFDLITYYEIDTSRLDWEYHLDLNVVRDITFFRSKYMSIIIRASMKDPVLAANIVNYIIDIIDPLREAIFKENTFASLKSVQGDYFKKMDEVNALVDSIDNLRRNNAGSEIEYLYEQIQTKNQIITKNRTDLSAMQNELRFYDLNAVTENVSNQLTDLNSIIAQDEERYLALKESYSPQDSLLIDLKSKTRGDYQKKKLLEARLKEVQDARPKYEALTNQLASEKAILEAIRESYAEKTRALDPLVESTKLTQLNLLLEHESDRLNHLRNKYEDAQVLFDQAFPKVYIIDRAKPSYKKESPSLTFNVMIGTLGLVFFSIIFMLFANNYRRVVKEIMSTDEA